MGLAGTSIHRGSDRLRTLEHLLAAAIVGLVVVTCAVLATTTTLSRIEIRRVIDLHAELRMFESIRMSLGTHARQTILAYVTGERQYDESRLREEQDLLTEVGLARAAAANQRQRELVDEIDAEVHEYLIEQGQLTSASVAPRDKVAPMAAVVQVPMRTLYEASRLGFESVARADRRAAELALVANVLGLAIAVFVLGGALWLGATLRRRVYAPLLALGNGIDRFAAGDTSSRVVRSGAPELQKTVDSFNEMAERLERQKHDFLTFLAGVAHDLRNPLAAMRMGVKLLGSGVPPEQPGKVEKTLALLDRQVSRLERMVGDFLDAARIEGGHLELQVRPVDARMLATEAADAFGASSPRHHLVCILPEMAVEVPCDAARIAQVLDNLMSNAIKYSPQGGDIVISVIASGGDAIFSVRDPGIGIAASDLPLIFEPFRRSALSRDSAPGVGLGLSVARRIIEAHGGRIEVESTLGAGSTFRVHLPLVARVHEEAPVLH